VVSLLVLTGKLIMSENSLEEESYVITSLSYPEEWGATIERGSLVAPKVGIARLEQRYELEEAARERRHKEQLRVAWLQFAVSQEADHITDLPA
jgi:hypothetical protein